MKYAKVCLLLAVIAITVTGCALKNQMQEEKTTESSSESGAYAVDIPATEGDSAAGADEGSTEGRINDEVKGEESYMSDSLYLYDGADFKIPQYDMIHYEAETEGDISEQVTSIAQANYESTLTYDKTSDRAITQDDTVMLSIAASLDGTAVTDLSYTDLALPMDANIITDDFTGNLVGKMPGETVTFTIQLPEDYANAQYAGKTIEFSVDLQYIQGAAQKQAYDDNWVKENTEYSTKQEYEEALKAELEAYQKESIESSNRYQIRSSLVSLSEFTKIDDTLLAECLDSVKKPYIDAAEREGIPYDEYVESVLNVDPDQFEKNLTAIATDNTKWKMIVNEIASIEKISVSDSDLIAYEEAHYYENGFDSASQYNSEARDEAEFGALEDKVYTFLLKQLNNTRTGE